MPNGNEGPSGSCDVAALKQAIAIIEKTIQNTQDAGVRQVLNDCITLIKDVCVLNAGFGAALRSRASSA
jgi:hypothetical protein